MKYKGYYIESQSANGFKSKEEIDKFIKLHAIEKYKTLCRMFENDPTMECNVACCKQADILHYQHNMTYTEIESIENEIMNEF